MIGEDWRGGKGEGKRKEERRGEDRGNVLFLLTKTTEASRVPWRAQTCILEEYRPKDEDIHLVP